MQYFSFYASYFQNIIGTFQTFQTLTHQYFITGSVILFIIFKNIQTCGGLYRPRLQCSRIRYIIAYESYLNCATVDPECTNKVLVRTNHLPSGQQKVDQSTLNIYLLRTRQITTVRQMLLLHIRKMIRGQQRYSYSVLDHREEKNVELVRTNNFSSTHLLWLVDTLEYFQCAKAYQLLRSKTLVSARQKYDQFVQ